MRAPRLMSLSELGEEERRPRARGESMQVVGGRLRFVCLLLFPLLLS